MSYASVFVQLPQDETVAAVQRAWAAQGWTPIDPFAGYGRPAPQAMRAFAAPAQAGWTRVLCERLPDEPLLCALATEVVLLAVQIEDGQAALWLGRGGVLSALPLPALQSQPAPRPVDSPLQTALPAGMQALNTHPGAAGRMFARLSDSLLGKAGGADQRAAALALLAAEDVWSGAAGQQAAAALHEQGVAGWETPVFAELRDAYALARRRQRRPEAAPLPGDADMLARVPDALAYHLLYAAKGQAP